MSTSVVQGTFWRQCQWNAGGKPLPGLAEGEAQCGAVESLACHWLVPTGVQRTKLLGLWLSFERAVLGCEGWARV